MLPLTAKRLQYAQGYIGFGMLSEASVELEAVAFEDRLLTEVLLVRVDLHSAASQWEAVTGIARLLTARMPKDPRTWILWGGALRRQQRIGEAKAVLLRAERDHGHATAAVHYNLACYHCLSGELNEAKLRLARSCRLHPPMKLLALDEPDLAALRDSSSVPPETV